MYQELLRFGLRVSMLVGLGLSGAQAAAIRSLSPVALGLEAVSMPVAMCGYSCRSGGRYIPGPPGVCSARGLNYCGSSQGWGGPPGPPPGRGYGGYDGRGPYGRGPGYGGRAYGGGPETDGRGAYGRGSEPSGRGAGRRAQTPQPQQAPEGNPYGQGPGRCGSGLC